MRISNPISNINQIGARSHSSLQNLGADDHTQYYDTANTREVNHIVSGVDASKPASPAKGDLYYATDTKKLYIASAASTWQEAGENFLFTSPAQGQVIYHNGTNWVNLAVGTSGQFLQTKGAAANPAWATALSAVAQGYTTKLINDASTAQTIAHGLGVTPLVVFFTWNWQNANAIGGTTGQGSFTAGSQSSSWDAVDATSSNNQGGHSTTNAIKLIEANTSGGQAGVVSVDGTNITITWTKVGAPNGRTFDIIWTAIG